jgi:hypothetical protein
MADVTTAPMEHAEAEGIMALINSRAGGLKTVLLYNHKLPYPSSDPDRLDLRRRDASGRDDHRSAACRLHRVSEWLRRSRSGRISRSSSARRATTSASSPRPRRRAGQGAVTAVEITPALPDSVAPGDAVTVLKPSGKFKITPGSAFPSSISTVHETISFSAEQTYAA